MAEQPEEKFIQQVLKQPQSEISTDRKKAVKMSRQAQIKDECVAAARRTIVENNPSEITRAAARQALTGKRRSEQSGQTASKPTATRNIRLTSIAARVISAMVSSVSSAVVSGLIVETLIVTFTGGYNENFMRLYTYVSLPGVVLGSAAGLVGSLITKRTLLATVTAGVVGAVVTAEVVIPLGLLVIFLMAGLY